MRVAISDTPNFTHRRPSKSLRFLVSIALSGRFEFQGPALRRILGTVGYLLIGSLAPPLLPAAPMPDLRFERISIEQGLSQSTVNCIFQDQTGFLWLGTQSGLNRFDGHQIRVYRRESGDLSHDWVTSLAEDPEGLWIGTEGGGITHFNHSVLARRHLRHDPSDPGSLSSDRIRFLLQSRSGDLWIGTVESGLNRLRPGHPVVTRFLNDPKDLSSLPDDRVRALVEDAQDRLWIGTLGGLSRFDPSTESFTPVLLGAPSSPNSVSTGAGSASLEILALHLDHAGRLWIGTQTGLLRLDTHTEAWEALPNALAPGGLSHDWVRTIFEDRDGRVWVGTDGGLNLWQGQEQGFVSFRPDPSNPDGTGSDQILSIKEDRSGNIWLGTFQEGAKKWNPRSLSFQHLGKFSNSESGQNDNVFAISADTSGDLWTGSFGGGVSRTDRETLESQRYLHDPEDPASLTEDRVTALLHDTSGRLWAGTVAGGLNRLMALSQGFEHFLHDPEDPGSLSADSVTALHQDQRGQIWVGTYGGGLNRYLDGDRFEHFERDETNPSSLSNDRVFAIADELTGGGLWLATDGGGLNLMDPETGTFSAWRHDPDDARSLSSDELLSLHVDAEGRLWIGTKANGLDLLTERGSGPPNSQSTGAKFNNFSQKDGFPDPTIWGIESDSRGFVWLGTNNGLVRFDPTDHEVRKYDTSHGLQSMEFNQGAHFRSADGELFFGGVNGVNAFFPEKIRDNVTPPPVALTDFTVLNQRVELPIPLAALDNLQLEHDDHFLTFEFAALDFTAPERNQYRYQLGGFEESWVDLGTNRTISFTSLNPGKYVLRVQGSNSDGVWSDPGASLAISVAPPLWRTWWFRSLLLLFAAATATLAHQLRIHRIRVNNERLHALVKERTRDLEEAQERLVRKEKLAVLGELSGSVAHELRNPLGIIKNSVFFLRLTQKMVDDKAKEHLALIDREIKRSDRIIGELLDYAKEPTAQTERTSVRRLIESSLESVDIPDSIQLVLQFGEAGEEPQDVQVDPGQIERVLGNLLSNAVQAMPEGGTLSVNCSEQGSEVWIQVRDTGVGIEEEDLEKVFEPLFTRKIYGIGLGLPLSLRYVRMNGGRLKCESRVGEGTTFHLYLPPAGDTTGA